MRLSPFALIAFVIVAGCTAAPTKPDQPSPTEAQPAPPSAITNASIPSAPTPAQAQPTTKRVPVDGYVYAGAASVTVNDEPTHANVRGNTTLNVTLTHDSAFPLRAEVRRGDEVLASGEGAPGIAISAPLPPGEYALWITTTNASAAIRAHYTGEISWTEKY